MYLRLHLLSLGLIFQRAAAYALFPVHNPSPYSSMSIRKFFVVKQTGGDDDHFAKKAKTDGIESSKPLESTLLKSKTEIDSETADLSKAEDKLAQETADECSATWTPFSELTGDWREALLGETKKPYFAKLTSFLSAEIQSKKIFPPAHQLFTAFNLCQLKDLKVVIVGQDPYHAPGQAHGLAFSVQKGVASPPSLKNIYKEAMSDVGIKAPCHGNLESWAKQGVLLLNTCLTVRQSEANSHQGKGWY